MSNFPHDDYVNVSDLTDRIDELRDARENLEIDVRDAAGPQEEDVADRALEEWDAENREELEGLEAALDELQGYGGDHEWEGSWYPGTLIADSYFTEAMRELVEEIGGLPSGIADYIAIDWDATAENLRVDYSSVVIDGTMYWYR